MILFGPSGTSDEMKLQKFSLDKIADWLVQNGLTCFEYPLTHGTNISDEKCKEIKEAFCSRGIALSVHAPYYINFASPVEENVLKTFGYLYSSMQKAKLMGADRVVFHPGALTGQTREDALANTIKNIQRFVNEFVDESVAGVLICPETMGKHGQVGTPAEVLEMCKISPIVTPTIDFGHVNAFTGGKINSVEAYADILRSFESQNKKEIHIHFSKIEYGGKGEIKHLTFATDPTGFGPNEFEFVQALTQFEGCNIRVVCESSGTQDTDSKILYNNFKK